MSTIRRADQILVVEAGRIVERGTHAELYAAQGRYYDLYTKQHGIEANLFLAPGEGDDATAAEGAVRVAGAPGEQRGGRDDADVARLSFSACAIMPSRLNAPGPAVTRYKKKKQYSTVISPPLSSGKAQGPMWMCTVKYATAISPHRMNATGRVNSPRIISGPPMISIMPANHSIVNAAAAWPPNPPSAPNFCAPCKREGEAGDNAQQRKRKGLERRTAFGHRSLWNPKSRPGVKLYFDF